MIDWGMIDWSDLFYSWSFVCGVTGLVFLLFSELAYWGDSQWRSDHLVLDPYFTQKDIFTTITAILSVGGVFALLAWAS